MNAQEKRNKRRQFYRKKQRDTAPLPKLNMDAVPDYGEIAARLMAKMGFKEGMGLGKIGDGIREPVAVDAGQKKTGLGYVKAKRKRRRRRNKTNKSEKETIQPSDHPPQTHSPVIIGPVVQRCLPVDGHARHAPVVDDQQI